MSTSTIARERQTAYSFNDLQEKCLAHMTSNGIPFEGHIVADEEIHRFSIDEKQRNKDEWYVAWEGIGLSGHPYLRCSYASWSTNEKYTFNSYEKDVHFDKKDRETLDKEFQEHHKKIEEELQKKHDKAAIKAKQIWDENEHTEPTPAHLRYCEMKGIKPVRVRFGKNPSNYPSIIVPLYNIKDELRSLQFISVNDNGTVYKTFLEGAEKKECFCPIGELKNGSPVGITEGYSTGISCHEALKKGFAIVIAFNCGSLDPVTKVIRKKYPNSPIVIFGDDDIDTISPPNPGRKHAMGAAKKYHATAVFPKFPKGKERDQNGKTFTDFNDLAAVAGIKEVVNQIGAAFTETVNNSNSSVGDEYANISVLFADIIRKYGEPFYLSNKGNIDSINQSFWAGLNIAENLQLFEPDEKCFYRYDDAMGLYSPMSDDVLKQDISSRMLEISRNNKIPSLEKKRTMGTLNNILSHLKGLTEHKHPFEYEKKGFIHLKNGFLKIHDDNTVDLVPFSPRFRSRNQSPIAFQEDAKCERFLNELLCPAVDAEDAVLIQKYAGLCLLGDNLIQRILILGGEAGQGKSQLAIVLQELVGLQNVTELRTRLLSERFELYRYLQKTLLIGVDVPANFLMQKGAYVLKGLTGGDWFDAEKKGSVRSFQMKGNYCIVITANSRLQVQLEGDVNAWRRRILLVEYNIVVPKKNIPNFGKRLIEEEGSGILNWALMGLQRIWDDINTTGGVILGERQKNKVDSLLAESDSVRHFLKEKVTLCPSENVTREELEEAYTNYCPSKGWNPKPIMALRKKFAGLMLELFSKTKSNSVKRDGKNQQGFRGVALDAGNGA
jgi:putative DNA primase/helicase